MLHAKAEQDDLVFRERDGGGFAGELLGALGVAGDENVFGVVWMPGEHKHKIKRVNAVASYTCKRRSG